MTGVMAGSCRSGGVMVESVPCAGPFAGVVEQADTRDLKSRASQEACRFKSGLQHHRIHRSGRSRLSEARSGQCGRSVYAADHGCGVADGLVCVAGVLVTGFGPCGGAD